MVEFTRRQLMATSVAAALGASVSGVGAAETSDGNTPRAPFVRGKLKRFSSTALGAEVTGPFVFENGTPLYSLQHPSEENPEPYDRAGVGYFAGFQFSMDGSNADFTELSPPQTSEQQGMIRSAGGEYDFFAHGGDTINANGDTERLGVVQTPDGTDITQEQFSGTMYGDPAANPDCNQFIPTNADRTAGYLFTNWENSPGNVSRIPISQDENGGWNADLERAINLANTEPFREIGGTRINCYGDLTPWNTMISAEENYAHPRVSGTTTVGDIVTNGTGEGRIGACQFWNRPAPSEIQSAIEEYYDNPWTVQGWWAMSGIEFLAYYLGAQPTESTTPIEGPYPNPYRYGYFVDVRKPMADPPQPVKYYVMGRASWEAPDIQNDLRTVYGCSDGDSKGIYKFVADRPIPSYHDPMAISGTLYAPNVTNEAAAKHQPPADVPIEIEWLELGHATNREVESWIAEYDEISQVEYLTTHTDGWTKGDPVTDAVLKEADKEVIENGNRNYITNEEIVKWAEQYEAGAVDEDLRKVPFLETRAAATEIGATIEFNKAEGVDSHSDATPGDPIYFAISSLSGGMTKEEDLRIERVDGGVVYRGTLEHDYNVSTLEPVIVGPDASDPATVADDALINVDNLYVMDDGRVLCCEDADQLGRSYSNDCLYVYQPGDTDCGHGNNNDWDSNNLGNSPGEDQY